MGFADQLAAFGGKTKNNLDLIIVEIVSDIGSGAIYRTPVGAPSTWRTAPPVGYVPGRARGGWAYTTGAPLQGLRTTLDASGAATASAIRAAIPAKAGGKVHYLSNNTPYIYPLEMGHSKQAPFGIIGTLAPNFNAIAEAAALRVVRQ